MIEGGSEKLRNRLTKTLKFLDTPTLWAVGGATYQNAYGRAQTDPVFRSWAAEQAKGLRQDAVAHTKYLATMTRWDGWLPSLLVLQGPLFLAYFVWVTAATDPAATSFGTQWSGDVVYAVFVLGATLWTRHLVRDLQFLRTILERVRDRERANAEGLGALAAVRRSEETLQ